MIIALVGNKSDLEDGRRIRADEARAYAEENGVLFMETSAKTAQNVSEIFESIGTHLSLSPSSSPRLIFSHAHTRSSSPCRFRTANTLPKKPAKEPARPVRVLFFRC